MKIKNTASFYIVGVCVVLCVCSACVSNKAVQNAIDKSVHLPPPVAVRRPLDSVLADFGSMVTSYITAATGERPIPIEIDFIDNQSGVDKELPNDLGQYARAAIERIGYPFETFRAWPTAPRIAMGALQVPQSDRQKPPQPMYRLVGSLLRASERLTKGADGRSDGQIGGGHTRSDLQITGDQRRTITSLTISLTLEDPAGVAVPGATAVYRIDVEKNELNRSVSVYVGGSGLGGGSKLTTTQDSGDALYDAMAITVVHLLGNALMIPYYRCSPIFSHDEYFERRERDILMRLTTEDLEQISKRYLFVAGHSMDMGGPDLTDHDRAILASEMRQHSLDSSERLGLVDFLMQIWESLDYVTAARTVADRMAQSALAQRNKLKLAARQQVEHASGQAPESVTLSSVEFGWAVGVQIVVVYFSRIKEIDIRERVLAVLRTCSACDEVRNHPTRMLLGVRTSAPGSAVQRALRSSTLPIDFVWTDSRQQFLTLLPR